MELDGDGGAGLIGPLMIWVALPVSLIWFINSQWLGKKQSSLEEHTFKLTKEKLHENRHY